MHCLSAQSGLDAAGEYTAGIIVAIVVWVVTWAVILWVARWVVYSGTRKALADHHESTAADRFALLNALTQKAATEPADFEIPPVPDGANPLDLPQVSRWMKR